LWRRHTLAGLRFALAGDRVALPRLRGGEAYVDEDHLRFPELALEPLVGLPEASIRKPGLRGDPFLAGGLRIAKNGEKELDEFLPVAGLSPDPGREAFRASAAAVASARFPP
jgi:hypothetical protein